MRHCSPIVTGLKCTFRGIDDHLVIQVLNVPLSRQLHKPVQIALFILGVKPSLIQRVQVMDDMHELSSMEDFFILLDFDVGTDKPAHPIVGDDHGGEDLKLTK